MLSKTKIKDIQSLSQKKLRDEASVFVAEGPKIIQEILPEANIQVKELFATKEWLISNPVISAKWADKLTQVEEFELEKISSLATPNQIIGIFSKPSFDKKEYPEFPVLMLDTIQDPGNMGTMIRIADWFGIKTIVCSKECVDCFNSKVVQSTMGSIVRVNIIYTNLEEYLHSNSSIEVYAAMLNGKPLQEVTLSDSFILLIGNESKGINQSLLQKVHHHITIPRIGRAESLNAAVATGIILNQLTNK